MRPSAVTTRANGCAKRRRLYQKARPSTISMAPRMTVVPAAAWMASSLASAASSWTCSTCAVRPGVGSRRCSSSSRRVSSSMALCVRGAVFHATVWLITPNSAMARKFAVSRRVMLGARPSPGAGLAGGADGVVGELGGAGMASAIGSSITQQFPQRAGGVPEPVVSLTRPVTDADSASPLLATLADRLRDRYGLQRELGRGGMATVFLAEDLKHQRLVALNVLHPDVAEALGSERFQRRIE